MVTVPVGLIVALVFFIGVGVGVVGVFIVGASLNKR